MDINMDTCINEDSVRSFSQLVKRAESDPGPAEFPSSLRSSIRNGKSNPDDEMDVELPTVIRQDSIASRTSVKNAEPSKPKIQDLVLKVTVAGLFLLIVVGVSVIFHFHKLQLHMLQLSRKIKLNEDNRVLTIERNASFTALIGRLGMHLPDYEWPYDCSDSNSHQTHKCLRWQNRAQLDIYFESKKINETMAECHSIHWQELSNFNHKDCYLLDSASWTGGGVLWQQDFPSSDPSTLNFVTTTSPDSGAAGQVLEPLWISSRGVSLFVERHIPLSVSVSNLTFEGSKLRRFKLISPPPDGQYMCLAPNITPELKLKFKNLTQWLNYTICIGNDVKAVQQYAMKYKIQKSKSPIEETVFMKPIFSAKHLQVNFSQSDIIDFAKKLNSAGLNGTILINPGWEVCPGEFSFQPQRFENPAEMVQTLHDLNFQVNLPVHPYVGVHSQYFAAHSDSGFFLKDGGNKSPGLTRWRTDGLNDPIVAVMDLANLDAAQDLQNRIANLKDAGKPDFLSFYGGDASSLPYMAYQSMPQINEFTEQFANFAANVTDTVFLQSAYAAQNVNPIVMLPCDNSTWPSLRVLLKRVITLGIIGYGNVLQGPIGGCDLSSVSEELYIRWLQLGAFFPVMHFSGVPSKVSSKAGEVATEMLRIHNTDVLPVIVNLQKTIEYNGPFIRPLWWLDPQSRLALKTDDQFMVGDNILVAPVMTEGATSRDIYLPQGRWTDGWDDSVTFNGPKTLTNYTVTIEKIPYFRLVTP